MSFIKIYGIKNCDTMKKALKWLDKHGVAYEFHNYKKEGLDKDALQKAIDQHGWENAINKRGTSWRNLPDNVKATADAKKAIELAEDNPSLVKRPLLVIGDTTVLGFSEQDYKELF